MKRFFYLVLLLASTQVLANDLPTITHVELVEFGIYMTSVAGTAPAPDTTTGKLSLLSNPRLVRTTTTIPAVPKSSFGIRYQIVGEPAGAVIEVTDVVITPGLKDPESQDPIQYKQESQDITRVGKTTYTGYTFDKSWEAVPGKWKVEVWHKDRRLLTQEFNVVKMKLTL
jgi:hypothetical protein